MPREPKPKSSAKCEQCGQKHKETSVHPPPTRTVAGPIVRFWSGASAKSKLWRLSNLARATVELDGKSHVSSEHAYVAATVGEPVEDFDGLATIGYTPEKVQKAKAFWGDKVGVVAKIHGNIMRMERGGTAITIEEKREVWMRILRSKFSCPQLREILLSTGDAYLLEFCRGAVIRSLRGNTTERWGGWDYKVSPTESRIWGDNEMGHLLMRVRNEIRL
jgi:predicted NAD-dependent protein-ADP-ribosyltransferase YbiA (DUF1768 family)